MPQDVQDAQEPTGEPQAGEPQGAAPKSDPKTLDVSKYPEEVRQVMADLLEQKQKANREAASFRKKVEALMEDQENKTKEAERAKLEETERLKLEKREAEERATQAEERANRMLKETAIVSAASRLNFHNPRRAASYLDLAHIDITNGQVDDAQVMEALTKLALDEPYLINTEKPAPSVAPTIGPTSPTPPGKVPGETKTQQQNFRDEIAALRNKGDGRGMLKVFRKRLVEQSGKASDLTPIK